MLNTIISPENLAYFTAIDAMGQPRECTYCPPNTERCAHFDGHWVRLTNPSADGVPAVAWNFSVGSTLADLLVPRGRLVLGSFTTMDWILFYYPPSTLSDAEEDFHRLNAKMRKIASEGPGDVST